MPQHAVVSGASIAGLATASWLRGDGWDVTVLERAIGFRDGGQNVDVRGVAREVLRRMDLFDAVADLNTTETGTVIVDEDGGVIAELPSDDPDGATAELEVLRGDLARAVLDRLPDGVEVRYGDPIASVDDRADHVALTLASGEHLTADLLVVAEGVRSSTRDLVLAEVTHRRELGIAMVFGTIPRTADDDRRWRWHNAIGGRQVHLRPDDRGTTRAILAFTHDGDIATLDRPELLAYLREHFDGVGWEAPRVLDALETSDDLYVDQLAMLEASTWHRGRTVLVGDSAWCVTSIGGGGASLALVGAYVLAAQLCATEHRDLASAFAAYEEWMRPLVDQAQSLPPGIKAFAFPQTSPGLAARNVLNKVLTSAPLRPLTARITHLAETDQELPPPPAA